MSEVRNAIIESVSLDDADRGLLTAWVHLDYGNGAHQGFGGHTLYLPPSFKHHEPKSWAGMFIWRVMEVAGVSSWAKVAGKTVRARVEDGLVKAIGHIVKDDWFCPSDEFRKEQAP